MWFKNCKKIIFSLGLFVFLKLDQITSKLKRFNEEKTTSSISEQLKYLANLKRDLGLKIKVNDYEKDVIDSALKNFTDAYKETEILQAFLNQN